MVFLPEPKTLPVGHGGILFVLVVSEGSGNHPLDPALPVAQGLVALHGQNRQEAFNQCHHSPHDLHTVRAAKADLIQRQPKKILPGWKRNDEPELTLGVVKMPDLQMTMAEPQ